MEVKYRQERNECYMLVDAGGISADHYQIRMLENNRIDGLLKVKLQQINQQSEFCYTISGRQSMVQKYGNVHISAEEIKKLMAALNKTAGQLEEFLLNIDSLRLEPEWIYWKADGDELPEFCYYPEETPEKSFREHVRTLLQYLLNKISHKDPDAVNAAYGLYRIGMKETFRMQELMQFLFYGTEENEASEGEEYLSSGLREDGEEKSEERYKTTEDEMSDEDGRRKRRRQKQQRQKVKRGQNQGKIESQKPQREYRKKQQVPGQRRLADYILSFLIALLALAAVLRLAFLLYGRQGTGDEKDTVIYIGLICTVVIVSGIAIDKLMVKTDDSVPAWGSPGEAAEWEHVPEYGDQQGNKPAQEYIQEQRIIREQTYFPEEAYSPKETHFSEETCILAGISSPPAGGWRFCYQGTEKNVEDFFLNSQKGQVMVGKKLKAPDIGLNWPTVSRHHAVFQIENGICTVRDCGSTNGTYLDGDRLGREETRVLFPGSELKFADVVFRVEETAGEESMTTILNGL